MRGLKVREPTPYEIQQREVNRDPSPYRIRRTFPDVRPEFEDDVWGVASQEEDSDLWVYWNVVRQHLRLILTLVIGAELLTALVIVTMTPLYTGVSTIMIEHQMPQLLDDKNQQSDPEYQSFYKTQYEILKS